MNTLNRLWLDDCGGLIATEWIWVCSLLVLGAVAGMVGARNAINAQLDSVASGILAIDPEGTVERSLGHSSHNDGHLSIDVNVRGPLQGRKLTKQELRELERIQGDGLPCD